MATVLDMVGRALRVLRVVDVHDVPEAADVTTAIAALNAMMQRWEANGLALGWSRVTSPDDRLPIPEEAEEAVAYNLAVRLRSEYGIAVDPDVIALATEGLAALRRDRIVASPIEWVRTGTAYDIRTDSYY